MIINSVEDDSKGTLAPSWWCRKMKAWSRKEITCSYTQAADQTTKGKITDHIGSVFSGCVVP